MKISTIKENLKTFRLLGQTGGYTLLELLLYISLYSIIMMSIMGLLLTLLQVRIKSRTVAEVDQQGIQIMQSITQAIRNSDNINSPLVGASADALSLDMPEATLDPTVFDLSNGTARITEAANAPVVLSNSLVTVSDVTFTNLSRPQTPGNIRVQFIITYINNAGRNEYDYSKTFTGNASLR